MCIGMCAVSMSISVREPALDTNTLPVPVTPPWAVIFMSISPSNWANADPAVSEALARIVSRVLFMEAPSVREM